MKKRISISEFTQLIEFAETKYPNAKVMSIGTGLKDGTWHFTIWLEYNRKEVMYEIPMYTNRIKE